MLFICQVDMRAALRLKVGVLFVLGGLFMAGPAQAQAPQAPTPEVEAGVDAVEAAPDAPTPQEEAPAAAEDELSPEELKALEAALAQDADAAAAAQADAGTSAPNMAAPSQAARIFQSMNPDISVIMDVAGAYFSDEPLQVGAHDPNKTGFTLQQLELHIGSSVDPFFRMDANIVFALFGVEVEEIFATTTALPGNLQLRAGQFLTRFGRLNSTHPHSWSFLDQPLVNGKFFGGEGSRGLGLEASWLTPLPWYVELVGSVNNADGACCARSFYGGQDLGVDGPSDLLYTLALKQFFELGQRWMLLVGLSGQLGPNPSGKDNRTEIYGADVYLRYRPGGANNRSFFEWQTELMHRRRQQPGALLVDSGLYSQIVWQVDQQWGFGLRYELVEGVDDDPLDPDWSQARQRVALQGSFYPSHFSRVRGQLMWDQPRWRAESFWGAMLGLEILVGAHGAHNF